MVGISNLSTLSDIKITTLHKITDLIVKKRTTSISPLRSSSEGVVVGAALNTGLLHRLKGAPSQERNAIVHAHHLDIAMMATFSGHGKHGLRLADLSASTSFRHIRRRIPSLNTYISSPSVHNSSQKDLYVQAAMERVVQSTLTAAYSRVAETVWAKSSAVSITMCLIRKGMLAVGACGLPSVMLVSKKNGRPIVELISDAVMHTSPNLDSACSSVSKSSRDSRESTPDTSIHIVPDLEARFSFPKYRMLTDTTATNTSGDIVQGACIVPTTRTFTISNIHTHVVVSTMRLWPGDDRFAPPHIASVFVAPVDKCVIDLAEELMKAAFGRSGPTHDCSVLCSRLC